MKHEKSKIVRKHTKTKEIFGTKKSKAFLVDPKGSLACNKCGKKMKNVKKISFNEYYIDGWRCSCGEIYFDPEQAQKVLLLNKLKKQNIRAKLGRIRSNLILRLPKDIETVLNLKQGEEVKIKIEKDGLKILTAF